MSSRAIDVKSWAIGLVSGVCLLALFGQAPATAPTAPAPAAPPAHRYDIAAAHVMNGPNVEQTVYILDHQTNTVSSRSKGTLHNLWGAPVVEFKASD